MQIATPRPLILQANAPGPEGALEAFRQHWPEYLMEAGALGTFMFSACAFGVLLEHPGSPLHHVFAGAPLFRRGLMGLAMGLTAISIIHSPWGKRSGAHMNPSVTLTYLALGKLTPWDAAFYVAAQFGGGIAGVFVAGMFFRLPIQHAAVNYVVTVPGPRGVNVAFLAELSISMLLMFTILQVSNSARLTRFTPLFAGAMVAMFITAEAPLSGMSMNPARTFGSALNAHQWTALWIYFTAPLAGMLLAAGLYRARRGAPAVYCAKLHHCNQQRCIFHCNFGDLHAR